MAKRRSQRVLSATEQELVAWFLDCAYVRQLNEERRDNEGWTAYKKGHEIRFILESKDQVRALRRCLRANGLRAGKPYPKHSRIVQPVYGREAFDLLLELAPGGRDRKKAGFAKDGRRLTRRPVVRGEA